VFALLPPLRSAVHIDNLRERGHSFSLPDYNTKTYKNILYYAHCTILFKGFVHWTWFLFLADAVVSYLCCLLFYTGCVRYP